MNSKTLKMQRNLKQKLMAAISMLLVSSLMLVTSTYAWFTLSTAPEVTGITTAVGANGNLEMALLNPGLQDRDATGKLAGLKAEWEKSIISSSADSMDAAGKLISEANITWGNLVDLSDTNTYGLNNINLYPSQLQTTTVGGDTIAATPLSRPVFGADGRVAELKADTLTASYASNTFSNEGAFGVRAVGTSSSMTARELAHRAALSSASTASTNAKSAASGALKTHGNVLAGMAITHVGDEGASFTYEQVNTLKQVIEALATSHSHIENAMKWYIVAHNIAPETENDSTYLAIQNKIMDEAMTLALIKEDSTITKPSNFDAIYEKLEASKKNVTDALDALPDGLASGGSYVWSDFSGALNEVMDYNEMMLNGLTMNQVTEKEGNTYKNASVIINAMGKEGLQLQMGTGSGVFADIADFCGTYSATITFPTGTNVMGVEIGGVEATMTTNKPANPTHLATMRENTNNFAAAAGGEATKSITDFYGYIVDLAFRTNAAGSNLLLQADATDRIYGEEGNNEDTMGGGSTMTFTASEAFGVPSVQALMKNLRIVFFATDTNVIIGEARLDSEHATIEGNVVTMKMGMWDKQNATFKTGNAANVITGLSQNQAKAISVLVYLDGTTVTNADVATSGTSSMTGTMNLQFSSDAELAPMEYTDLKDGKSSTEPSQTINMTKVDVDAAAKEAGIAVTKAIGTSGTGFGVILSGDLSNKVVKATVSGNEIQGVPTVVSGVNGYTFAYTEALTAETTVVISVTEAPAVSE